MYVLLLKLTIAAGLLFLLAVDAPGGKTGKYQVLPKLLTDVAASEMQGHQKMACPG